MNIKAAWKTATAAVSRTAAAAPASDTLVQFCGVKKTYDGENLIVKNLDLDIRRGEFLTLLGPSGSGKTTCLMMLAGFEFPTSGEIRLDGQLLNRVPPHKRNIGMVFQNYALFPHMTIAQNVAYPLSVRKMDSSTRAAKVKQALDMVQMGNSATAIRPSCRVVSNNAWHWRARWCSIRNWCSWTNRWARSTNSCANICNWN